MFTYFRIGRYRRYLGILQNYSCIMKIYYQFYIYIYIYIYIINLIICVYSINLVKGIIP